MEKSAAGMLVLIFAAALVGCISTGCGQESPPGCPQFSAPAPWYEEECFASGGHIIAGRNLETCCWGAPYCADGNGNVIDISNPNPEPTPSATLVPGTTPSPTPTAVPVEERCGDDSDCIVTGCSSQVCALRETVTTCEYRPEYGCFAYAQCKCTAGRCGWTSSVEYDQCMFNINERRSCVADGQCNGGEKCFDGKCLLACGGADHVPCAAGYNCTMETNETVGACVEATPAPAPTPEPTPEVTPRH